MSNVPVSSRCETGRVTTRPNGVARGDLAQHVKVMVVDDQVPFREAARAVVERLRGFDVVGEAESGEGALQLANALEPDLVLMDINMGGIDGIEATRRLTAAHPATIVFLLSTYQLSDLPPAARTCGAHAYLNKDDLGVRTIRQLWEAGGDPLFSPPK
jgi:two-component system, NarL family, invasion response regulator UvrY